MSLQNLLSNPHKFKAFEKEYKTDESPFCVVCGHGADLHICEICEERYPRVFFKTMRMCNECYQTELAAQKELEEGAEKRVEESHKQFVLNVAEAARKLLDERIQIRSDYFNADIPGLLEIRENIFQQGDKTTEEKQFEYTSYLKEHITHLRDSLISIRTSAQEAEQKIGARMKLMQSEIQQQANLLREDERKKLQLENINYQPVAPKVAKTPKAPSIGKAKVDTKEIAAAAKEHGIPEQVLTMLVKFKGYTVGRAVAEYKSAESTTQN